MIKATGISDSGESDDGIVVHDGPDRRFAYVVVTPEGKYAAITGAPRGQPGSGMLWVVDIAVRNVVGRVAGVGNETDLLALLP